MTTKKKIVRIVIEYENNESLIVSLYDLEKIKQLSEAVEVIERARDLYADLKKVFK